MRSIVLLSEKRVGREKHLSARLDKRGLLIEGQNLWSGDGAPDSQQDECEFGWRIENHDIPVLMDALDCSGDLLVSLKQWFTANPSVPFSDYLSARGVRYEFWSRMDS